MAAVGRRVTFEEGGGDRGTDSEDEEMIHQVAAKVEYILQKLVKARVMTLSKRLVNGGHMTWIPDAFDLRTQGVKHEGANVIDLARNAVRDREWKPQEVYSPSPPPSFDVF